MPTHETRFADITDGTSNTAMTSESTFWPGGSATSLTAENAQHVMVSLRSLPLSETRCSAIGSSVQTSRNGRWADGWPRYSGYDHYLGPDSSVPDYAVVSPMRGLWKAARSRHPGGVNLLLCDGSVRFIGDTINLDTWHWLGSRNGGEVLGEFELPVRSEFAMRITCFPGEAYPARCVDGHMNYKKRGRYVQNPNISSEDAAQPVSCRRSALDFLRRCGSLSAQGHEL